MCASWYSRYFCISARRSAHLLAREIAVESGGFVCRDEEGVWEGECELEVSVEGVVAFSLVTEEAADASESCRHFCFRLNDCALSVRSLSSLGLVWGSSPGRASSSLSSLMVCKPETGDISFSSRSVCGLRVERVLDSVFLSFFEEDDAGGGKSHCRFPFLQPFCTR
jgi:hypothetical protein